MIFIIHIKYHPYFANIDRIMDSIAGIIIAGTIRKVIVIISNSQCFPDPAFFKLT